MKACINKSSAQYQSLKERAGISEFMLEAVCRNFLDKYGRLPYLDELPKSNSEPHLKEFLGVRSDGSAKIQSILDATGRNTVEEAMVDINDQYRDLETIILPINKDALVDIAHRPTDDNFDSWTEEDYILAKAPRDEYGNLLAPNGKISNLTEALYVQVRTKAFKNWFGDWINDPANASKVVDENGEPLVVYHGGAINIKTFKNSSLVDSNTGSGYYTDHITGEKIPLDSNRTIFFSDREGVGISYALIKKMRYFEQLRRDIITIINLNESSTSQNEFAERFKTFDDFVKILDDLSELNPRFNKLKEYIIKNRENNKKLNDRERSEFNKMLRDAHELTKKLSDSWRIVLSEWYNEYHTAKNILDRYDNEEGLRRLLNGEIPDELENEYRLNQRLLFYRTNNNLEEVEYLENSQVTFNAEGLNTYVTMNYDGESLKIRINDTTYDVKSLSYSDLKNVMNKLRSYNENALLSYSRELLLGKHSSLYEVFLNIRNPFTHDYEGTTQGKGYKMSPKYSFGYMAARLVNFAINNGHDGVIYLNLRDPYLANNYGVFKSSQIKSATDNTGLFSKLNDDITDDVPNSYLIMNNALQKLADLYGIKFNEVTDAELNSEKWKDLMPDDRLVNAFIYNGEIYINLDRANIDAPIHEMFHMLIGSLRFTNPNLYQELVNSIESIPNYNVLAAKYEGKTRNDINEEILVSEFAKYFSGMESSLSNIDKRTEYEITYNVKRMLDTILMGKDSVKTISDDRLFSLTLKEVADIVKSYTMTNLFRGTFNVEGSELHRKLNNTKSDLIKEGTLEEICE